MPTKKPNIKSAAGDKPTLYLYDDIGPSWAGMIGADLVRQELDELGEADSIRVRINSGGGDVFEGMAIRSLLVDHAAQIEVLVDGLAASIASVIATAGDTIRMAQGSMIMIHNPWSIAWGEAKDFRKTADLLDQIAAEIAGIYTTQTGLSEEEIKALMDEETWMGAAEAVEKGFADAADEKVQAKAVRLSAMQKSKLRHVPDQLKLQQEGAGKRRTSRLAKLLRQRINEQLDQQTSRRDVVKQLAAAATTATGGKIQLGHGKLWEGLSAGQPIVFENQATAKSICTAWAQVLETDAEELLEAAGIQAEDTVPRWQYDIALRRAELASWR